MSRRQNHLKLERYFVPPKTCGEKRRYQSQQEAVITAAEQELLNPGLALSTYRCLVPGCGGWHLTRKKQP